MNLAHNHAQAGYSITNHVSLFTTGYWRRAQPINILGGQATFGDENDDYSDKSYEVTGGASYFTTRNRFIYEVHMGAGGGKITYSHMEKVNNTINIRADRATVFIQPSIAYQFFKNPEKSVVELGAFARAIAYRYHDLETSIQTASSAPYALTKYDSYFFNRNTRDIYFVEPGACFRVGGKEVKFSILTSFPISLQGDNVRYRTGNLYLSVFINLNVFARKTYGYNDL